MDYRHEHKFEISPPELLVLRRRLRAALSPDPHARGGSYRIRSLYFDTPEDRALREKLDGVSRREKFRLRYYDGDTGLIHLEKKSKLAGLGCKQAGEITADEARRILAGDRGWMADSGRPLVCELGAEMASGLRPRTVVDYVREPFVFPPGNVRVTLDYGLRTALRATDFLDPNLVTVPAPGDPAVLEVKWDNFLPDMIRDLVTLPGQRAGAFSKYAACRLYDI